MSNSMTEHSKALRAKTAIEWKKKQLAEGTKKQLTMTLERELFDAFAEFATKNGYSKPQALKALLALAG